MSGEVVSEVGSAEEETLDLVIETQLADGHQNLIMCKVSFTFDSFTLSDSPLCLWPSLLR